MEEVWEPSDIAPFHRKVRVKGYLKDGNVVQSHIDCEGIKYKAKNKEDDYWIVSQPSKWSFVCLGWRELENG